MNLWNKIRLYVLCKRHEVCYDCGQPLSEQVGLGGVYYYCGLCRHKQRQHKNKQRQRVQRMVSLKNEKGPPSEDGGPGEGVDSP